MIRFEDVNADNFNELSWAEKEAWRDWRDEQTRKAKEEIKKNKAKIHQYKNAIYTIEWKERAKKRMEEWRTME